MGVQKTTVVVEVDGEQQAAATARRLEDIANRVKAKADQAKQAVNQAETRGRLATLTDSLKRRGILSRSGFELGPVELKRSGFGLNAGFFRGSSFGAAAGVTIAGNVIGRALEQTADWVDVLRENDLSAGQVAAAAGMGLLKGIFEFTGSKSILRGISRLSGTRADVFDEAYEGVFAGVLGTKTQADIDIMGVAAAQRERWAQMRKLEEAEQKRRQAIEAQTAEIRSKLDELEAQSLRGIKAVRYPLQLPEATWKLADRLRRENLAAQRAATEAKLNERMAELLDGDGD